MITISKAVRVAKRCAIAVDGLPVERVIHKQGPVYKKNGGEYRQVIYHFNEAPWTATRHIRVN